MRFLIDSYKNLILTHHYSYKSEKQVKYFTFVVVLFWYDSVIIYEI